MSRIVTDSSIAGRVVGRALVNPSSYLLPAGFTIGASAANEATFFFT